MRSIRADGLAQLDAQRPTMPSHLDLNGLLCPASFHLWWQAHAEEEERKTLGFRTFCGSVPCFTLVACNELLPCR